MCSPNGIPDRDVAGCGQMVDSVRDRTDLESVWYRRDKDARRQFIAAVDADTQVNRLAVERGGIDLNRRGSDAATDCHITVRNCTPGLVPACRRIIELKDQRVGPIHQWLAIRSVERALEADTRGVGRLRHAACKSGAYGREQRESCFVHVFISFELLHFQSTAVSSLL